VKKPNKVYRWHVIDNDHKAIDLSCEFDWWFILDDYHIVSL